MATNDGSTPRPLMPEGDDWNMDLRPKRFGWAPGGYLFRCRNCKHNGGKDRTVIGDKRAMMCADCAYALPDDPPKATSSTPVPAIDWLLDNRELLCRTVRLGYSLEKSAELHKAIRELEAYRTLFQTRP